MRLLALVMAVALVVGGSAEAQSTGQPRRIGFLSSGPAGSPAVDGFRQGMRELGWVEGTNLVVDYRFAEGQVDRLPDLAADLVRRRVEVIVAGPTPPAIAAKDATRTIPIVMLGAADPVELGLVASLARPGGNVTGLAWSANLEVLAKGLELLKEALPKARLVAVIWNPANPAQARAMSAIASGAQAVRVQLLPIEVRGPEDFDAAFAAMANQRVDAVLVIADSMFAVHRARLAELEAKYRLPSMHGLRLNVESGGLMAYGPSTVASWRHAAYFVDRILKGAKPADLPVEHPSKYELVINLKTAKALGLTIPQSLLVRADQLVQ
jgi:putative ABC transport system substrate-binding protein